MATILLEKYNLKGAVNMVATAINNDNEKFQKEMNDLKQKYDTLFKEVKDLEDTKDNMKQVVQSSYEVVQSLSKNVENVMKELETLKGELKNNTSINTNNEGMKKFSMKQMFMNPLRKIAVGAMQSAFLLVDKTVEGVSNAKEGFEDIVAEAQYQNKKKHLQATETI